MTNIDNIACDQVPYIIQSLMEIGACNVHAVPAMTKKGRNEYIFLIDAKKENIDEIAEFMASETGTIGLRMFDAEHIAFDYAMRSVNITIKGKGEQEGKTWSGRINVKIVKNTGGETLSARAEFEELKASVASLNKMGLPVSFYDLREMVEYEALKSEKENNYEVSFEIEK
ncbi:MAG TPA: nickel insertion protein [Clostridia bacterium]|nr:nickel insertion protein [Clostridia bacterium]